MCGHTWYICYSTRLTKDSVRELSPSCLLMPGLLSPLLHPTLPHSRVASFAPVSVSCCGDYCARHSTQHFFFKTWVLGIELRLSSLRWSTFICLRYLSVFLTLPACNCRSLILLLAHDLGMLLLTTLSPLFLPHLQSSLLYTGCM